MDSSKIQPKLVVNRSYFATLPGLLKLVQFFVGIVMMFLVMPVWVDGMAFIALLNTTLWICVYFFGVPNRWILPSISWLVLELFLTFGITLLYTTAVAIEFTTSWPIWYTSSMVGCFVNSIAYGVGGILLLNEWRWWSNPEQTPSSEYRKYDAVER